MGAGLWLPEALAQAGASGGCGEVKLPPMKGPTETEFPFPKLQPPEQRVGWAIVALGRLSLEELLPAFGESQ